MHFSVVKHTEISQAIRLTAFSVDHSLNETLQTSYFNQIPSIVHNLVFTLLQKIRPGFPPKIGVHSSVREVQDHYKVSIFVRYNHQVFETTIIGVL